MALTLNPSHRLTRDHIASTGLSLLLLLFPAASTTFSATVWAHAGHGDEFHPQSTQPADAIEIDPTTADRIGLKVEPVTRQSLAFGLSATGQIEAAPSRRVEVTNPVGGTVIKLLVEPGDRIRAGQPLAVITSGELAELRVEALDNAAERQGEVQQAEANLRLAQQTYAQQQQIAQTSIAQAQTELKVAQEQFDRDQELAAQGAIPRRQFLESEAHLASARKALTEAASRLEVLAAQTEVTQAQTALQVAQSRAQLSTGTYQTRLQQLGATPNSDGTITIKAPIAGTIADRSITLGQSTEEAGSVLMTIVDDRTLLATAHIHEKDLSQIAAGQSVRVTVASLPNQAFVGRITTIGSIVDEGNRVVPVKAELNNSEGKLKPGMFAELELLTDRTPQPVLVIPQTAIVEANGQQLVFVQNGNAFQPVEVTLGRPSNGSIEVKNGLFDGDQIVTQRANQLYAQSLRGGNAKSEVAEAGNTEASNTEAGNIAAKIMRGTWPTWMRISATGLLAIGTFAAGAFWANRRSNNSHSSRASFLPILGTFSPVKPSQPSSNSASAAPEPIARRPEVHVPDSESPPPSC
ncbi:MAG: efflux RND transporter periplasmic adaptor subunit [Elainella sp. Prado103]|nr:efflux RND transporter periplasmic adaptor subunit [Elainella sp. Prado103]